MAHLIDTAPEHAVRIRTIVEAHQFSHARIVRFEDPEYPMTLLVKPVGLRTLLDISALAIELDEALGVKVFVLTDAEFEATCERTSERPETVEL